MGSKGYAHKADVPSRSDHSGELDPEDVSPSWRSRVGRLQEEEERSKVVQLIATMTITDVSRMSVVLGQDETKTADGL